MNYKLSLLTLTLFTFACTHTMDADHIALHHNDILSQVTHMREDISDSEIASAKMCAHKIIVLGNRAINSGADTIRGSARSRETTKACFKREWPTAFGDLENLSVATLVAEAQAFLDAQERQPIGRP